MNLAHDKTSEVLKTSEVWFEYDIVTQGKRPHFRTEVGHFIEKTCF
jgi:hypothetical protein